VSERLARILLGAYSRAGAVAYPFIGTYVAWRASKGKEDKSRRRERYGLSAMRRPPGPLVWMHAASVGETNAVVPLIERILESEINLVLTTGTVTSASRRSHHPPVCAA
jgi:3-deoxy-D-manno-octulosonic-acid transferase